MSPPKIPNTELIDYQFKVMSDRLDAHQEYTKGEFQALHNKMDKFIDSCNANFATKEEHQQNKQAIEEIRESHKKIAWASISFI